MSAEHKRPLYAFVMVAMLCAFLMIGTAVRAEEGFFRAALPIADAPVAAAALPVTGEVAEAGSVEVSIPESLVLSSTPASALALGGTSGPHGQGQRGVWAASPVDDATLSTTSTPVGDLDGPSALQATDGTGTAAEESHGQRHADAKASRKAQQAERKAHKKAQREARRSEKKAAQAKKRAEREVRKEQRKAERQARKAQRKAERDARKAGHRASKGSKSRGRGSRGNSGRGNRP